MDLFDKLKSEPVAEKSVRKSKSSFDSPINCRESLPTTAASLSVSTTQITRTLKANIKNKSRSLSPLNSEATSTPNKQVRVLLERTKHPQTAVTPFKNITPTKAQQKQFDPVLLRKAQELQKIHVRPCYVRVKRVHAHQFGSRAKSDNLIKKTPKKRTYSNDCLIGNLSPPSKKPKTDKKKLREFHVKLLPQSRKSLTSMNKVRCEWPKTKTSETQKVLSVTPTKFRRTQLIEKFGKKFFAAVVKVERCQHPIMVAFDNEAREQRSKRNKSKNLSVSFHKEVEVYDNSPKKRNGKKTGKKKDELNQTSAPLVPALLQKIENGKVVTEIELDQSMFLNSSAENLTASTPITATKRTNILPLKDDNSTSHGRKHLKLTDEKLPPFTMNITAFAAPAPQNEEDDDVEFIVPELDIPHKIKGSFCANSKLSATCGENTNEVNNKKPKMRLSVSPSKPSPVKVAQKKASPIKIPLANSLKVTPTTNKQITGTPTKLATSKTASISPNNKTSPKIVEPCPAEVNKTPTRTSRKEQSSSLTKNLDRTPTTMWVEYKAVSTEDLNDERNDEELSGSSEKRDEIPDELLGIDTVNTSGESFISAIAEISENPSTEFKQKSIEEPENNRNRVETETISESSNASTDVQIASSETSNTTIQKSIEINSKSSPKEMACQQSNSNIDEAKADATMEDTSDKSTFMEALKYDDTNNGCHEPTETETQKSFEAEEQRKSFTSDTLNAVEVALKTFSTAITARPNDIAEGVTAAVNTIMELPIHLLADDTESSLDVNNKVENIIAELSKDNDKVAESTAEQSSSVVNSTLN